MSQNLNKFKAFDIDPLREHREMMASLSDPLKDLRLDTSFRDPLKEHREMMAAIVDPMKELRAMTQSFSDPLKEQREMMAAIVDPMKELRAMTQSFSDPLKEHREMMAAIADPMKEFRVAAYSLPDPLKEHREMMEAITNPMKQLQEAMALVVDPAKLVQKNPSLTILKQMAEAELFDVAMQSSGISKDEVNDISSEILTTSTAIEAESLERLLNNILQEVKALKEPKIQQVIATYIFPIIIMILGLLLAPVSDYHIKGYLQSDNRTRNKVINEQVVSSVTDRQQLNTFRFVSTDTLNVRTEASMKSKVLGYFHYGYVVNIVRKEKNWSLVEWVDQESELKISGWVHTRYLKRFK
ncbi:SH3 domain-containing protein [Vibrio maerlii]|uniref:SH3 domain-containing protein n=1 Tax=Vibrio maerlii TaxID=2231648 RepID=UPI000E3DA973|nr:SH3 domain-containing protein [Vibrio maerlii]